MIRRAVIIATAACGLATSPAIAQQATKTADILGEGNKSMGTVVVTQAPRGVILRITASDLPEGWHGMHIHSVGTCADPGFKASGGHVHSGTAPSVHGLLNENQTEEGDLPNIHAGSDHKAVAEVFAPGLSLGAAPGRVNLLDQDGSALIIHASVDDHASQPIGRAGPRIACAVIR